MRAARKGSAPQQHSAEGHHGQRRRQTVDAVKNAPMAGQDAAAVLDAGLALEQGFVEIAPSFAWACDIIALKAEGTDDVALAFMASNGRGFGFWNGRAQFFQPLAFEAAWRVA